MGRSGKCPIEKHCFKDVNILKTFDLQENLGVSYQGKVKKLKASRACLTTHFSTCARQKVLCSQMADLTNSVCRSGDKGVVSDAQGMLCADR